MHHLLEKHYVNRVGWLRAAVLGANDGLLSTTSIVIGVAAASPERNTIILAAPRRNDCRCHVHGCRRICFRKLPGRYRKADLCVKNASLKKCRK